MSVVEVLYLIGGIIAFFATILILLINYIWKKRNERLDEQLELGTKTFNEQQDFNTFVKQELENQKKLIEKQGEEFGVWKAVVSKINRGVESFNKTNGELLQGIQMLVTKQNGQEEDIIGLKKKLNKLDGNGK